MEEILFEVVDPRGCKVICTKKQWASHILREHQDMADEVEKVISAIKTPHLNMIYQDNDFEDRNIYYYLSGQYYIKVVVKINTELPSEIITAFKADNPKAGERWIWPESNV